MVMMSVISGISFYRIDSIEFLSQFKLVGDRIHFSIFNEEM